MGALRRTGLRNGSGPALYLILLAVSLAAVSLALHADSQRVLEFEYDQAGNVTGVLTTAQSGPPEVAGLNPHFINLGRTVTIVATGTALWGAEVSVTAPGLKIGSVSASSSQVVFDLTATSEASLGNAPVTFTTALGQDTENVLVADRPPDILPDPNPIVVPPDGDPTTVKLLFSAPLSTGVTFDVSITDTAVAAVSPPSVTLPQGDTVAEIDVTGLVAGTTELKVALPSQLFFYSFPVYVTGTFTGTGEHHVRPVGVIVGTEEPRDLASNRPLATQVGVIVGGGDTSNRPVSRPVGVVVGGGDVSNQPVSTSVGVIVGGGEVLNRPLATPVGVIVGGGDVLNNPLATPVGLVVGPLLQGMDPSTAAVDDTIMLTLFGFNLEAVDLITVIPPDDVSVGSISVNAGGTELTVPVTVAPGAVPGPRLVTASTPSGVVNVLDGIELELTIE